MGMRVDPIMDAQAKVALDATKTLHKRLRELERQNEDSDGNAFPSIDFPELKKLAAHANKAVQAMLIDREANAARIQDRQRLLLQQADATETLSAFDRAATSASSVEASIAALCPHQTRVAAGVVVIATAAAEA